MNFNNELATEDLNEAKEIVLDAVWRMDKYSSIDEKIENSVPIDNLIS